MALPLLLNQRYLIPPEAKSSLSNKESSQSKSCVVGLRYSLEAARKKLNNRRLTPKQ
jgi:hypothetical protein